MGKVQKVCHSLKQTVFFFLLPVVYLAVTLCPCLEPSPALQHVIRQSHVPVNRQGTHTAHSPGFDFKAAFPSTPFLSGRPKRAEMVPLGLTWTLDFNMYPWDSRIKRKFPSK